MTLMKWYENISNEEGFRLSKPVPEFPCAGYQVGCNTEDQVPQCHCLNPQ